MRKLVLLTAALLLIPRPGPAQTPQAPAATAPPAAEEAPLTGHVDFGGLFTNTTGDQARYERYRDLRDGAYSDLGINKDTASYRFDANAFHVGYRDQRYDATLITRKLDFGFDWVSIPLNYSYMTLTPYTTLAGGVLTLPDNLQALVQAKQAVGIPCAPGLTPTCTTAAQIANAKAQRSIYNTVASPFDLQELRNNAAFALVYEVSPSVDVDGRFQTSGRTGTQPWGASFAFNNAVELPKPLDERTNDATLGATWGNDHSSLRLGWDGSWYTNHIETLTWDNPLFLTNFNNGLRPPLGPYDPSGYSNGNGAAIGHEALAPSNYMNVVSATAMYKQLPWHTTLNGTAQLTDQQQNAALIPWTTNALILQPSVFALFPNLTNIPRDTAEASARGINALINMTTRPSRLVNFNVRYRYNSRDVRTPIFDATEYVRFDAVPEENPDGLSPQFNNSRHLFDATMAVNPTGVGTVRVGYSHEQIHREGRGFADVGEHIFRVSYDIYSNQYVSIRSQYDYGRRRGTGYVEAAEGNDDPATLTGVGGAQPTLRYYDEADRNRQRGSVVFTVMPVSIVDVYFQFQGARDTYLPDSPLIVSRPGELFGLQHAENTTWNVGLDVHPKTTVSFGANYGRDKVSSLEQSRNSNPPPDPTWTDPNRNWTLDDSDRINNATVFFDLLRTIKNTDIRVNYDYSDSDDAYTFGGPRIPALAALGQFIPLPNATNKWNRVSADVQYFFTKKVGVGFGYYYEKLEIADFATIDTNGPVGFAAPTGVPRIDWLGELMTGYGNRPYTGNTGTVRLIYHF